MGALSGIALACVIEILGTWPEVQWWSCVSLAIPSLIFGPYVGARSIFRRVWWVTPDNLWDPFVDGFLVVGGIAFCIAAISIFIAHGLLNAGASIFALIAIGTIGGLVNIWRRCIELNLYPRWRFAIGAALAAVCGIAFTFGSVHVMAKYPGTFGPVSRFIRDLIFGTFGAISEAQLIRGAMAFGIALGLGVYLLGRRLRRPRKRVGRSARAGAGYAGAATDAFIDAGHKIGTLVVGLMYLAGAAALVAFNLWQGDYKPSGADIFGFDPYIGMGIRVFHLVFYVAALVMTFMAVRELRATFKGRPRLPNEKVHGDAGDAGPEDADRAMGGGRSPVDDRAF